MEGSQQLRLTDRPIDMQTSQSWGLMRLHVSAPRSRFQKRDLINAQTAVPCSCCLLRRFRQGRADTYCWSKRSNPMTVLAEESRAEGSLR